jgi:hypothetical protein
MEEQIDQRMLAEPWEGGGLEEGEGEVWDEDSELDPQILAALLQLSP